MELSIYVYFCARKSSIKTGNDKFQDLIKAPRTCQVHRSLDFWFWRRMFLKVFTIYEHGGRHVTWTIYINFRSPFPRSWLNNNNNNNIFIKRGLRIKQT